MPWAFPTNGHLVVKKNLIFPIWGCHEVGVLKHIHHLKSIFGSPCLKSDTIFGEPLRSARSVWIEKLLE
jgi:hypothetical protein